jgi:membrane protein
MQENLMKIVGTVFDLLKTTFNEWNEDKAPRLAAALAYYTAFSIAPLLVIVIAVVGLVYGQEAARGQIVQQIQNEVGRDTAEIIQTMIENANSEPAGIVATVIGIVTIIFGAAGFFGQLQDALNTIWEVQPKPNRGIKDVIRERFLSFTMVLGIGFLLLVSLVISAVLSSLHNFVIGLLPGAQLLTQILNFVLSFGVVTLLFAMIYRVLPDVDLAWKDVAIGAVITALLFTIGKFLLSLYLGNSGVASSYGVAGSFVVLLLWVYYSAQILLFGAEFTQVYARRHGSLYIQPTENAMPVTAEQRAQEGRPVNQKCSLPPICKCCLWSMTLKWL